MTIQRQRATQEPPRTRRPAAVRSRAFTTHSALLTIDTQWQHQFIDITGRLSEVVRASGVTGGLVHAQSLHTTTGIILGEWQDALLFDIETALKRLVPSNLEWRHNDLKYSDCSRTNAESHLRGMLIGQTLSLQIDHRALLLGVWQRVIFAEFDGPRSRSLSVLVTGW